MRDRDRINRIVEKLKTAWIHNPDLRLGQLLMNAVMYAEGDRDYDLFVVEDDKTERGLDLMRAKQIEEGRW